MYQHFSFRIVIDTLKEMESDRKCFRMVGGVLVEHTVSGVLPALTNHKEQVKLYEVNFNLLTNLVFFFSKKGRGSN